MSATDLAALIERVEQADIPDRATDGMVDRIYNKRPKHGDYDASEQAIWRITEDWKGLLVRPSDGCARGAFCAANYMESIDAAASLLPAGWQYLDLLRFPDGTVECSVELLGAKAREFSGCGKSAAAAITATALRIKEAGYA